MATQMSEQEIMEIARKRVKEKKGFYSHLATYIVVNSLIFVIWKFLAGGGYPWFLFPLGGWGVGLIFHFLSVFVLPKNSAWEKREVEKEAEKLRKGG
jgi:hypothetical protein